MNYLRRLSTIENTMTKSEKRLKAYIESNFKAFSYMSCKDIGVHSNTSAASLIRFYKRLGYESLEEMKIEIASSIKSGELGSEINGIITTGDTTEVLVQKTISYTEGTFQKLAGTIHLEHLEQVIDLVSHADTVYIYGIGASSLAAMDLVHKLNRINIKCMYHQDGHMNLEFSVFGTPKDVVIALSYGGETKEVCFAAAQQRKNGCKVIAITKYQCSSLVQFSDVVLYLPNNEDTLRVAAIASKYAMLMVVDLIYLGILRNNYTEVEPYLLETSRIVNQLK